MKSAVEWPLKSFEVSFVYCLNFGFCSSRQQGIQRRKTQYTAEAETGGRRRERSVSSARFAGAVIRGSRRQPQFGFSISEEQKYVSQNSQNLARKVSQLNFIKDCSVVGPHFAKMGRAGPLLVVLISVLSVVIHRSGKFFLVFDITTSGFRRF